MEEEVTEPEQNLMWAHRWPNGHIGSRMYLTRAEARSATYEYSKRLHPSVVRVQITVLKDRK